MPPDLPRILVYDLSPLRPWEYATTDAYEWTEAVQLANAYHEARREVDIEAGGLERGKQDGPSSPR